ncbi:MAG: hypothetical protein JW981_06750, partial [Anaerolineae bacterium]|nr:hypothetical protein [Anaerolineae bacterium]
VFTHPTDLESPLRAQIKSSQNDVTDFSGWVRLNVVSGRFVVYMSGMPQPPADKVYVGWFLPLYIPEGRLLRIEPIIPSITGDVNLDGITGAVKGPPIEQYYTLALCYYFLDQCEDAQSYIEVALRIDPNDANALQTQRLCWE